MRTLTFKSRQVCFTWPSVAERLLWSDSWKPRGTGCPQGDTLCANPSPQHGCIPRAPFLSARWESRGEPQRMSYRLEFTRSLILWKSKRNLSQAGRARGYSGFCFYTIRHSWMKATFPYWALLPQQQQDEFCPMYITVHFLRRWKWNFLVFQKWKAGSLSFLLASLRD